MSQFSARAFATVLDVYGRGTPCHPGKWRVIESLTNRAMPAWTSARIGVYNGTRFELDLSDYIQRHIYFRDFDSQETRFLRKTIKPGWVALDVGANVGYYSLLFSELVGPRGRVYAFEPFQDSWQKLSKTIELNSPTNVVACKLALSDSCGKAPIIAGPPGNLGKTHLGDSKAKGSDVVEVITLDSFVENNHLKRLDIVKVDIEGNEEKFLMGGMNTIQRLKPLLLMELNPAALTSFGTTAEKLTTRLRGCGYRLFKPTWAGLTPLRRLPQGDEYINVIGIASEL